MNSYHEEYHEDEASWIGVSISRQQSRLVSPRTAALAKVQALQDSQDFFGQHPFSGYDGADDANDDPSLVNESGRRYGDHESRAPTASRSFPWERYTARSRASSGPGPLESIRAAIAAIPKKLSISSSEQPLRTTRKLAVEDASFTRPAAKLVPEDTPPTSQHSVNTIEAPPKRHNRPVSDELVLVLSRPELARLKSAQSLRRSASDESLAVSRTFSQASSLGDDSRFEHIQNQVNSRMKAIRDSWSDANIKLPSLPGFKTVPSFSSLKLRGHTASRSIDDTIDSKPAIIQDPLEQALSRLKGTIIVMGGYRGSVLRSAKAPHRQLWVPMKAGLNLRKVDLEVGIAEEDDHKPSDSVMPGGMLKNIGPVDISARLLRRLRVHDLDVHDYGYDWRLDPRFLSKQLCEYITKLNTKVTIIAHSLGGLIVRHAVNQKPELFESILYAGVPTRCINILGPLRNGDDVLLSSRVLTAQVNFTIRTSFALLPLDGRCFLDINTGEQYPVDFFNPNSWRDYRLTPCISRALLPLKNEPTGIASYVLSITNVLKKPGNAITAGGVAEPDAAAMSARPETTAESSSQSLEATISTAVTIPSDEAFAYLTRTLASVKRFKQELSYQPKLASRYPPIAVIYGRNTPTVIGAKVDGRDGIGRADAYDNLTFGSGDGVVLARASMPPNGYTVAKGGMVSSERGHVSLLADLDAVGKALLALIDEQDRRAATRGESD